MNKMSETTYILLKSNNFEEDATLMHNNIIGIYMGPSIYLKERAKHTNVFYTAQNDLPQWCCPECRFHFPGWDSCLSVELLCDIREIHPIWYLEVVVSRI